jgi:hypothetical protein
MDQPKRRPPRWFAPTVWASMAVAVSVLAIVIGATE